MHFIYVCMQIKWPFSHVMSSLEITLEDHNGNKFFSSSVILCVFYMCNIYYILFFTVYIFKFYLIKRCLHGLTGSTVGHRSVAAGFKPLAGLCQMVVSSFTSPHISKVLHFT